MARNASHCPACSGTPALLGALGRTKHYRCIHCGWQWAKTPPAPKTK